MATATKPDTKRSYPSWFTQLHAESRAADDARIASRKQQQLARATRIETDIKTKYDQLDTNNRLADRISSVRAWRDLLNNQLQRLKKRSAHMRDSKYNVEEFLVKVADMMTVNVECLTHLDHRRDGEYILDPVDEKLREEQELFNELQRDLQSAITDSFNMLLHMQDSAKNFYTDIEDKTETIHIDTDLYNLNEKSGSVGYRAYPHRKPNNQLDLQTWEDISHTTLEHARTDVTQATELIHKLHKTIHMAANRISAKADEIESALRMRIHDTERAFKELEYQRIATEKEAATLLKDIRHLEDSIRAKKASLKLAETRLDKRQDRPHNENNDDAPQLGLNDEISALKDSIDVLEGEVEKCRASLSTLNDLLGRICQELQTKRDAWQIYREIMNIRKRLQIPVETSFPPCPMIPNGIVREPIHF